MKKVFIIGFVILVAISGNKSFAQCSDAGVCQLGFAHEESTPKKFDAEYLTLLEQAAKMMM